MRPLQANCRVDVSSRRPESSTVSTNNTADQQSEEGCYDDGKNTDTSSNWTGNCLRRVLRGTRGVDIPLMLELIGQQAGSEATLRGAVS